MKKLLKVIWKILILICIIGFVFIQYLKSDFNNQFEQKKLNELKLEIEKANSLPSAFVKIYNKVYKTTNTNGILFDRIRERYHRECPCLNVAQTSFIRSKNRLLGNEYVLAWKLEKEFTQEQCLFLYAKQYHFLYGNKGINSASKYYFNKKITELNYDEMATLVIMLRNPSLYNPIKNPENVEEKLNKLKKNNKYENKDN